MKRIFALALVLVMILGLVACANMKDNGKKTIAVIAKGESHAFWQAVKAGAQKAADEKGYNLTFQGPGGEDATFVSAQVGMVQTALSNEADGIVLATIGAGFGDLLTQAYDNGIPIVTFDSGLKNPEEITEGKNPIVAHVATDNKVASAINGKKLFEAIKADIAASTETYVVGVIQHDQTQTGIDRTAGFVETFKALADADSTTAGKYTIEIEIRDGDKNQAYVQALEALNEKGVKALFMTNEGVVKQVYDATKSSIGTYDHIIFSGFDAGTKQLTWMKENGTPALIGSVAQDSIEMGYQAVLQCIAAIEGGKPANQNIVGTWYDTTNLNEMLSKDLAYTDTAEDKAALLG
jgi:ribose transport system substrate-binding protein